MEKEKFVLYVRADATNQNDIKFFGYDVIHFNMIEINESIMKNCVMNPDGTNNATIISDGKVVLNDKTLYLVGRWRDMSVFIDGFGDPYVLDVETAMGMRDELGYNFKYCILHKKSEGRAEYIGRTSGLKAIDIIRIGELYDRNTQDIINVWFDYSIDGIQTEFSGLKKDEIELIHMVNAKHLSIISEGLCKYYRAKCQLGLASAQDSFKSIELFTRYKNIANSILSMHSRDKFVCEMSTELFSNDFCYNLKATPEELLDYRVIEKSIISLHNCSMTDSNLFRRGTGTVLHGVKEGSFSYTIYFNKSVCSFKILADGNELLYEIRTNAVDKSHMGAIIRIYPYKNGDIQLEVEKEYTEEVNGDTKLIENLAMLFPDTFKNHAPVKYSFENVVDPLYKLNIKQLYYKINNSPDFERSRYMGLGVEEVSLLLDNIVDKRIAKGSKHWEVLENTVANTMKVVMIDRYDFFKVYSNFKNGKTARGYDKSLLTNYEIKIELYKDGVVYRSEYVKSLNPFNISETMKGTDVSIPNWYSLLSVTNIYNFTHGKDIILDREWWTDTYFINYTTDNLTLQVRYSDFLSAKMEYTTGIWYILIEGSNYKLKCKMTSSFAYSTNATDICYKLCAFKSREDATEFMRCLNKKFVEYTNSGLNALMDIRNEVYYSNSAICNIDFDKIEIDRRAESIDFIDIMMTAFRRKPVREMLYNFIGRRDIKIISD